MFFIGSASTKHQISTEVSVLGDEIAFFTFCCPKIFSLHKQIRYKYLRWSDVHPISDLLNF